MNHALFPFARAPNIIDFISNSPKCSGFHFIQNLTILLWNGTGILLMADRTFINFIALCISWKTVIHLYHYFPLLPDHSQPCTRESFGPLNSARRFCSCKRWCLVCLGLNWFLAWFLRTYLFGRREMTLCPNILRWMQPQVMKTTVVKMTIWNLSVSCNSLSN